MNKLIDIYIYIYIYTYTYRYSRGSYLVQNAIDGVFLPRSSRRVSWGLTPFSNAALALNR